MPWIMGIAIPALIALTAMCAALLVAIVTRGPFTRASAAVAAFSVPGLCVVSYFVLLVPFGWDCLEF